MHMHTYTCMHIATPSHMQTQVLASHVHTCMCVHTYRDAHTDAHTAKPETNTRKLQQAVKQKQVRKIV